MTEQQPEPIGEPEAGASADQQPEPEGREARRDAHTRERLREVESERDGSRIGWMPMTRSV
jgi:hypothetical protein